MKKITTLAIAASAALSCSPAAFAQENEWFEDNLQTTEAPMQTVYESESGSYSQAGGMDGGFSVPSDLDVTLGLGAMVVPEYLGADDYEVKALPILDVRYRQQYYLNVQNGAGYDVLRGENYNLGGGLDVDFGREDDGALRGMGDVDPALEAHIHGAYAIDALWLEASFNQDVFNSGHEGWHATAAAKMKRRYYDDRLAISAGPSVTYGSDDYMMSYFGVTPGQAARSAFGPYEAEAGFRDFSFDASAVYSLTPSVSLLGFGGYKNLLGDAADSPVSESDHQFSAGVGLGYKF